MDQRITEALKVVSDLTARRALETEGPAQLEILRAGKEASDAAYDAIAAGSWPKPAIPAHFIDRVAASLPHGESVLDDRWKLRIEQQFRAPTPGAPPGAAVAFYPEHARVKPPVTGGVRFSVSATHLPDGGPCQIGWLAWNDKLADEVWRDAINTIDLNAVPLGSLCPLRSLKDRGVYHGLLCCAYGHG